MNKLTFTVLSFILVQTRVAINKVPKKVKAAFKQTLMPSFNFS